VRVKSRLNGVRREDIRPDLKKQLGLEQKAIWKFVRHDRLGTKNCRFFISLHLMVVQ